MALESEIMWWNNFSKALRASDREAFEHLLNTCKRYTSRAGKRNATSPF
jgi:hypothetical protein